MCMIDTCDDYARVFTKVERTARVEHKCGECGRKIEPGERYEAFRALSATDDYWWSTKTCEHCLAAREWLTEICGGFVYHGVHEDLENHWEEDVLYRTMALGRVLVGIKYRWRWKGRLMQVPSFQGSMMTREGPVGV